jgi:phosphoribosyl 1,2-cyclic phosphate phosphodiesterase
MRLTLLGTGTSFGVPQIGCGCAVCRSSDPRDQRSRTAALVDFRGSTLLIDTPPELRLQLLRTGTTRVDAVLYTHEHADHVGGIDDLRIFSVTRRAPLPVFASSGMMGFLRESYRYIFDHEQEPYAGTSKPRLDLTELVPGRIADVAGVPVLPLAFTHGHGTVLGFRIGAMAYLTDVKQVSEPERELLIETARAIGARRTILTHLTHETGHAELAARLPEGVEPGFDGQILEVSP